MRIILAGIMGRHPYGGVAWCSLMYVLGLRDLGHEVWYVEDTGECNFDPVANTLAREPSYALRYIDDALRPHGLQDNWCYVDYCGDYHGKTRAEWLRICRDADVFINLSGGAWRWREEYAAIPLKAFVDSDPAFTQLTIGRRPARQPEFFEGFDALFTFGSNIGSTADVPTCGFTWIPTWQPVVLSEWTPLPAVEGDAFTTIMSWRIGGFRDVGGNKDEEFLKVLDLPRRVGVPLEIAINGKPPPLEPHGWRTRHALTVSLGLEDYRDYIRNSLGEFSVAKATYVDTRSGWFSDRTQCYLAAGRPAVVQDTGFSAHLPTGAGLLAWSTADQAAAAIDAVLSDYSGHAAAAHEVAREHFAAGVVLTRLLTHLADAAAPAAAPVAP